MKNKVIVRIMGHEYTLRSEDTREYMQRVANVVDDRTKAIAEANKKLSTSMVAVLTALNFADDYVKLQDQHHDLHERMQNPTLEVKLLREELDALKRAYHEKVMECDKLLVEFNKQMKNATEYETGLSAMRAKMQELVVQLSEKESRMTTAELVSHDAVRRANDMEIELDNLKEILFSKDEVIDNLEQECSQRENELSKQSAQIISLEGTVSEQNAKIAALQSELDEFIKTFDADTN